MSPIKNVAFGLSLLTIVGCATPPTKPAFDNALFSIQLLSQTVTPGWARDAWLDGNSLYVADDEQGITVWDVSNLEHPVCRDTILTVAAIQTVAYSHMTDLVMGQDKARAGGVTIYDRTSKVRLSTLGAANSADFKFRELAPDTIIVVDVDADASGCQFMKFFKSAEFGYTWSDELKGSWHPAEGILRGVLLDGNYIYLAHGEYGVSIISVDYSTWGAFPATLLGNTDTPGSARDLAFDRNKTHLLVADYTTGLQVVDITNRAAPRVVGSLLPGGVNEALKVRAIGDTAIFFDKYNGIFAVDCSQPTAPKLVGIYHTTNPYGLCVRESDRTIFLCDQDEGLLILKFRDR